MSQNGIFYERADENAQELRRQHLISSYSMSMISRRASHDFLLGKRHHQYHQSSHSNKKYGQKDSSSSNF